jgi:hypothetical protein
LFPPGGSLLPPSRNGALGASGSILVHASSSAVQTFKFIAFCVDFLGSKSGEFVDVGAAGREECGDGDPAFLSDDVTMGA